MIDAELRLRCLELALAQVKAEGRSQDLGRVAEIQTWFYDHVIGVDKPASPVKTPKSRSAADKAPEIFG